jgi:hypothetical protein
VCYGVSGDLGRDSDRVSADVGGTVIGAVVFCGVVFLILFLVIRRFL